MKRLLLPLLALGLLAGCQTGPTVASATPTPTASDLHCAAGDSALSEPRLGWEMCYPATWVAHERDEQTTAPKGVDATFDITETKQGPTLGLFGFMIISADDRGGASTLQQWVTANVGPAIQLQPIAWGNAVEAGQDPASGKRYALTPHEVIILELRSGTGNLDLEAAMSSRLNTWKFTY